ncbi:hypothetical protein LTR85_000721 [Meristemomyces frigidus]|nr:hypothetical protein LTR85_000721 [Meristemomyces frigidus]
MSQAITRPPSTRPPSYLLAVGILDMTLRNAIASATSRPRPFGIPVINNMRAQLLQDAFFDPTHCPEELAPRLRPSNMLLTDTVVLLAKVIRVLRRQDPPTEDERVDRIAVRNKALIQPFFDRGRPARPNPFADDLFEDEACFVEQIHPPYETDKLPLVNLQNDVHPLFAPNKFIILNAANYELLKPAFQAASLLLTKMAKDFWLALVKGEIVLDSPDLPATFRRRKKTAEMSQTDHTAIAALFTNLTEHIHCFRFWPTEADGLTYPATIRGKRCCTIKLGKHLLDNIRQASDQPRA